MRRLAALFFHVLVFCVVAGSAKAQVPRLISYQGVLTDTLGAPKSDGSYSFTFRFYRTLSGGSPLWAETKTLETRRGLFSTMLGDQSSFPDSVSFAEPYWLSVQIGSEELTPRIRLGAVGYAIRAINADTAKFVLNAPALQRPLSPALTTVELSDNAVTTTKVANDAITTAKLADGSVSSAKLANNSVSGEKILDGTITRTDVASTFVAPKADTATIALTALSSSPTGNAGGDLTGTFPNPTIAAGAVTSEKIGDGTITRNDVTATFVAPKADTATVALTALSSSPTGAAGGDLSGTFPNPLIATSAVTTAKVADGAITSVKLSDTSVTTAKIVGGAVTDQKIASMSASKLTGTVQDAQIAGTYSNSLSLTNTENEYIGKSIALDDSTLTVDSKNHRVGIRVQNPNSTLHVGGSLSLKVVKVAQDYTVSDETVILTEISGDLGRITLPDASTVLGRIYFFKYVSGASVEINTVPEQLIDGNPIYSLNSVSDSVTIISDGSNWHVLSQIVNTPVLRTE
ncbi:MAG TPA: hypothetical protein VNN76_02195 [Bacteroidota bacterium]|nr:hypothetical protein [Bacteroidota bacterium]